MTKLLVSVRNADEARVAVAAGVSILDIKEPTRGSLGAANEDAIQQILADNHDVPISLALGELEDETLASFSPDLLTRTSFVKVGLANRARVGWMRELLASRATLPLGPQLVAVAYADWPEAAAPKPIDILNFAINNGFRMFLIDTYSKAGGNLRSHFTSSQLAELIERAHDADLAIALAGSLQRADIIKLLPLAPDVVAVRGAACSSDRSSPICEQRVAELVQLVSRADACGAAS